jgi:ParB family chromosome partitioning protein
VIEHIKLSMIDANPGQPRKLFDAAGLRELAASIGRNGLMQPLVVLPAADGRYVLIAGERRWRACRMLDMDEVPAVVRTDLSERDAFVLSVTENLVRADMTIIEEARAFGRLEAMGMDRATIGVQFGKGADYVTWRIGLLSLIPEGVELVERGQVGPELAWHIARLGTDSQRHVIGKWVRGDFVRTADAAAYARAMLAAADQHALFGDRLLDSAPVRERRQLHRRVAGKTMARIAALHLQVDGVADADPAALAVSSPDLLDRYEEQLAALAKSLRRAQRTIRNAKATKAVISAQS